MVVDPIVIGVIAFIVAGVIAINYYRTGRPKAFRYVLTLVTATILLLFLISIFSTVAKPVIYLYPTEPIDVSVEVTLPFGVFTKTIPEYRGGWQVFAEPSGRIDSKYNYLFYESISYTPVPSKGFVVKQSELGSWFESYLSKRGFNEREIQDFLEYWLPALNKKPYYMIAEYSAEELWIISRLNIDPEPDSLIRVIFYFKGLDEEINIESYKILRQERKGFTAVEWGGVLRE